MSNATATATATPGIETPVSQFPVITIDKPEVCLRYGRVSKPTPDSGPTTSAIMGVVVNGVERVGSWQPPHGSLTVGQLDALKGNNLHITRIMVRETKQKPGSNFELPLLRITDIVWDTSHKDEAGNLTLTKGLDARYRSANTFAEAANAVLAKRKTAAAADEGETVD